MNTLAKQKPKILFLFSDTGGGHRSAAEAIIEALNLEFGDQYCTEMVDIFKDYAPPPLKMLPALYPRIVRAPQAWGLGYHLSNGPKRVGVLSASAWPYVRSAYRKLVREHPSTQWLNSIVVYGITGSNHKTTFEEDQEPSK